MNEKNKAFIHIPNACAENWELMTKAGQGRHCEKCNNIVYDFSQMSDDQILGFLKENSQVHCGHFHQSQLRRDILPFREKSNFFLSRFSKMAAALFAILSLKNGNAQAATEQNKYATVDNANFRWQIKPSTDTIIISGIVKESQGSPLENASVFLDSVMVAKTDKQGKFSFEPGVLASVSHHLYFSSGDLITAVRSYHPAMLSTSYEVELYKKATTTYFTSGIFLPPYLFESPPVMFKANSSTLTPRAKQLLLEVANKMKNNPPVKIVLTAYPPVCGKQYISAKQVDAVKSYLIEAEGIAAERIANNCEVDGGAKNIVEIKAEY